MPIHVNPVAESRPDIGPPSLNELTNSIIQRLSSPPRSVDSLVDYCASRFDIPSSGNDAHRVIGIRLSVLTGMDDPIIQKLGALEAKGVLTAETVVRLALARAHSSADQENPRHTNQTR
jgi:hypothetical protein